MFFKSFYNLFFLVVLFVFIGLFQNSFAESKLGFVKVDEVIRKAEISKLAEDKLKKEFAPRDRELKKLGSKLKKLVEKFEKDKSVLSNTDKQKLQRDITNLEKDLQRKQREAREDLTQRKNEELAAVVEKARAVIKKIAEQEKYDLILENSVYASPKIDITKKVIKALNAKK
jgi:outer membrane protein